MQEQGIHPQPSSTGSSTALKHNTLWRASAACCHEPSPSTGSRRRHEAQVGGMPVQHHEMCVPAAARSPQATPPFPPLPMWPRASPWQCSRAREGPCARNPWDPLHGCCLPRALALGQAAPAPTHPPAASVNTDTNTAL
eukprot:CAMPEP_0202863226 /NCGR_PEP_ID=MMETSP1391-20130828/3947_1 /ASSEMBLY_ACC=CAM_ASM_000867 /TAXON_ID=1034604 /ORGANISM="Chlamydomonas leiostraca, Strain SAG 11-49" /LENGTH=138 /DNA_ID=CAMNT_0049542837 /DNA_START=542 /DNA_END=959 /DNA_ORIENTATION=+